MPGPKATNRTHRTATPNTPHRKVAKRLAARQEEYVPENSQNKQKMHKPGSQNRKK